MITVIGLREGPRFNESWLKFCVFMPAAGAGRGTLFIPPLFKITFI